MASTAGMHSRNADSKRLLPLNGRKNRLITKQVNRRFCLKQRNATPSMEIAYGLAQE
jgi:hypothetical protein